MDVLRSYSNRPDLLEDLRRTAETMIEEQGQPAPTKIDRSRATSTCQSDAQAWEVSKRLGPAAVQAIIDSYQAGATSEELAKQFIISLSSVKRLLRKHKARRKDQPQRDI